MTIISISCSPACDGLRKQSPSWLKSIRRQPSVASSRPSFCRYIRANVQLDTYKYCRLFFSAINLAVATRAAAERHKYINAANLFSRGGQRGDSAATAARRDIKRVFLCRQLIPDAPTATVVLRNRRKTRYLHSTRHRSTIDFCHRFA